MLRPSQVPASDLPPGSAPSVVTAAMQRSGTQLEPAARREFEQRLGHDFSAVRIHSDGEATRAAAALGAGAYTLGRHIVISEDLADPSTPEGHRILAHELVHVVQQASFPDHQLGDAPVLSPDHPSEEQARAGTGAATPLASPAIQRGPLDVVTSAEHITIDLSARAWRQSVIFKGGQTQIVYILRDSTTGEYLKVGKTTVSSLEGRFGEYVSAGNKWGRKLSADVFTMRKRPGRTVQVFEEEIRAGLVKTGNRLPWDNTGGRLGRKGKGIPAPKPVSESDADLELIDEVEQGLHDAHASPGGAKPGAAETQVPQAQVKTTPAKAEGASVESKAGNAEAGAAGVEVETLETGAKALGGLSGAGPEAVTSTGGRIAQVAESSGVRTAGRFLAREAPGLILQVALMVLFPPGVYIHNEKFEELSRAKLDPAVQDALAKQTPMVNKLLADDMSRSVYANVMVRLDYQVDPNSSPGNLHLYLEDITFLHMKITNEYVATSDRKFDVIDSRHATKQVAYSLLLYEPEGVAQAPVQQESEQEFEEDLRRPGMGAGSLSP
jgi:hypothetical protein